MKEIFVPKEHIDAPQVKGKVGLWRVRDSGIIEPITFRANQVQYSWGFIAANLIGYGRREYAVRYMYIEYENVADPATTIAAPPFARDEGTEYYELLAEGSNGVRDFLRVPLITEPLLGIAAGYEDYFLEGETGNKLTFFTQTAGNEGVGMVPFGAGSNSKVYGVALVAAPGGSDRSRDVIFARAYFDEADQTVKERSSQLGVTWETTFL